jgi:hypothetical protein
MIQVHITYWTTINKKREKADYYSNCSTTEEAVRDVERFLDGHEPGDIISVHYNRK